MKLNSFKPVIYLFISVFLAGCQSKASKTEFAAGSPEYKGYKLFNDMACNACHSIDGALKLGPSMKDQYGKDILHTDGTVMVIDDSYIRQSLTDPLQFIVEGYTPIMPSYAPVLQAEDIDNIIAYIKTLK